MEPALCSQPEAYAGDLSLEAANQELGRGEDKAPGTTAIFPSL